MLRRSDRYVLREMAGPFALALAGLLLFILLNIILSLSDLMVDRGLTMATLLRLVLLKVPSLLVVAVPMSVLFATFLGLGRMVHDREVVALESLGIPLRRVLLPLVLAAGLVAAADFAVYNWLVPASETAYQNALRSVIFRQGVPRITSNAFFKGPNDQFLYIRRYDESTGKLYDVTIYDTTGTLFPQAQAQGQAQLTILTADQGTWTGDAWSLENAHVYGFDRTGVLTFSAIAESIDLPVDPGVAELLARSRTTSEMGMAELATRVAQGRANGQRVSEYLVEFHLKMALPLASVIFVLVSGSLSLAFLPRSRAVGVVLGLLLVAIYQGLLWWTQTLGRRGAMAPALAAWLPDLLFAGVGLLLFLRVDRLASRDVWTRVRAKLPLALLPLVVLVAAFPAQGTGLPVHIECDELFVSDDRTQLHATGNATARFADTSIRADDLRLDQVQTGSWHVAASGHVELSSESLRVASDALVAEIDAGAADVVPASAEASTLAGSMQFTNSSGENVTLYFRADRGRLAFEDGRPSLLEAFGAEITTCNCCQATLRDQPYSVRANRLLLYPDRLLVAYGISGRAAGLGIVWLPLYVQPLKETLEAPLFPAIGRSAERGWFAKWSVPYFLSEAIYGNVNVDVYTRYGEVGLGGMLRYDLWGQKGEASIYHLPAKVGDSETTLKLEHTAALGPNWSGTGSLSYAAKGSRERLSYSFVITGDAGIADISLVTARALATSSGGVTHVTEQRPELRLAADPLRLGPVRVEPRLAAGWLREGELGQPLREAFRLSASATAAADAFDVGSLRVTPAASVRASTYDGAQGTSALLAAELAPTATLGPLQLAWSSTWAFGWSPLESDQQTSGHVLRWTYTRDAAVGLSVSGSYRFGDGLGDIDATLVWTALADWTATATYSPDDRRVTDFDLQAEWSDGVRSVSWDLPFDPDDRRFAESVLTVASEVDPLSLSLSLEADLASQAISSWDLDASLESPDGWGVTLGAEYSAKKPSTLDPDIGLFKDIAQCLRVGVERSRGDIWFYVSILAFPEAVLRYAPLSFDVEFGE